MNRIEKTQINISAFIILSSTLKKVKSDKIVEIVNDGRGIVLRPKEEHEKDEFSIDLTFQDELFNAIVTGDPRPLVVTGEAEQYLRNNSYACYYYRKDNERNGEFDHFDLFHEIHFPDKSTLEVDQDIVKKICGLFRVDFTKCLPFFSSSLTENKKIKLPPKKVFNEIFENLSIASASGSIQLSFESGKLEMRDSLDSLFAIKDLLSARYIDTKQIPEYNWFAIQQNEQVHFPFATLSGLKIHLTYRYDYLKIDIIRNI